MSVAEHPLPDATGRAALNAALKVLEVLTENNAPGFTPERRDSILIATLVNYAPQRRTAEEAAAHDGLKLGLSPQGVEELRKRYGIEPTEYHPAQG